MMVRDRRLDEDSGTQTEDTLRSSLERCAGSVTSLSVCKTCHVASRCSFSSCSEFSSCCPCCLRRSILSILDGSMYTLSSTAHASVTAKHHSIHQRIPEPLIMAYLCASARLRLANCFSHLLQKYVNVDETKVY